MDDSDNTPEQLRSLSYPLGKVGFKSAFSIFLEPFYLKNGIFDVFIHTYTMRQNDKN